MSKLIICLERSRKKVFSALCSCSPPVIKRTNTFVFITAMRRRRFNDWKGWKAFPSVRSNAWNINKYDDLLWWWEGGRKEVFHFSALLSFAASRAWKKSSNDCKSCLHNTRERWRNQTCFSENLHPSRAGFLSSFRFWWGESRRLCDKQRDLLSGWAAVYRLLTHHLLSSTPTAKSTHESLRKMSFCLSTFFFPCSGCFFLLQFYFLSASCVLAIIVDSQKRSSHIKARVLVFLINRNFSSPSHPPPLSPKTTWLKL